MKSIVSESDNRQSKMMFKLAVELAMLMNIIAATQDIDRDMPSPLRGECIKEVNGSMGIFVLRMP